MNLPAHANPIVLEWIQDDKVKVMPSGCWHWMKCRCKKGYGRVSHHGKTRFTHRLAINAPNGLQAIHSCDNPQCCNPDHLKPGTALENALDMKSKRRGMRPGKNQRCACGKACATGSKDCAECRSIRLGKRCHCGEPEKAIGLCDRHYHQEKKGLKMKITIPKKVEFEVSWENHQLEKKTDTCSICSR